MEWELKKKKKMEDSHEKSEKLQLTKMLSGKSFFKYIDNEMRSIFLVDAL